MNDLGTVLGGQDNAGTDINNAGQISGYAYNPASGNWDAFLYTNGAFIDLGRGTAFSINDLGQVVGDGPDGVFLYNEGQRVQLGITNRGFGINNEGSITTGFEPYLYRNGELISLNQAISPELGITLDSAWGINDEGQIVANGFYASSSHAYVLTPVPEPSTLALFGVMLSVLCLARSAATQLKRRRLVSLASDRMSDNFAPSMGVRPAR
jgi:probable HAF family extracellular repeat protein